MAEATYSDVDRIAITLIALKMMGDHPPELWAEVVEGAARRYDVIKATNPPKVKATFP